ncbi:MAG: bifunctional aspartate kinase/homoserine dehydrogenase I [Terrimonas sp.]|nr:bifunctional aspartate kinase/homoserine dehydrogenase I [Terrimonas sp.]
MQVLKFGGTSMGSPAAIKQVMDIVTGKMQEQQLVVIVSAMSGTTDLLLQCSELAAKGDDTFRDHIREIEARHFAVIRQLMPVQNQGSVLSEVKKYCNEIEDICNGIFLLNESSPRSRDKIMSYGELLSSRILSSLLIASQADVAWKDARELVCTDSGFGNAIVNFEKTQSSILSFFRSNTSRLVVMPGFIARNDSNITTTLGRGGSDYTAAIVAAAVDASVLEIWTDVSGMMTADPRLVFNARIIAHISYQEAMELSHFGAKVIYPPTIQPVMKKNIPVWIKNTFAKDDYGTLIENEVKKNGSSIRGISSMNRITLLSLEGGGMVGIPGFSKKLFEALAGESVNVILITQSSSEHSICVAIEDKDAEKAAASINRVFQYEMETGKVDPLVIEKDLSISALVGDNMKSHTGIAGKMFGVLGRNGVNIRAIAQGSSERNISAVIATKDVRKAVNVLHEEFFESTDKVIHLFVAGTGNVGKRLFNQLKNQTQFLRQHMRLQVKIAGICNSRQMVFNESGIDLAHWEDILQKGEKAGIQDFITRIIDKNLRNSVFTDVTANDTVAAVYDQLLKKNIGVVACNKVAASSAFSNYKRLKELSREYNAPFLFETNVGAGLPVIGTLNDLMRSGDKVNKIEAVLSGTLNFVFNNYDGKKDFSTVVKQAQEEGYTEPDPRLDLSGADVMRKILILAREAGVQLEMEEIACHAFLPDSCMEGSVEDFYAEMKNKEEHFRSLYENAAAENCKLKFVASYENGKAEVGLRHIPPQSDFYHLYGKDNIVLFYTERYPDQPLVIKGAGAGAEVTASGVFADILRAIPS